MVRQAIRRKHLDGGEPNPVLKNHPAVVSEIFFETLIRRSPFRDWHTRRPLREIPVREIPAVHFTRTLFRPDPKQAAHRIATSNLL